MDQPKEPRPPVNLRIKFRSASLEQFIERYAVDVSRGGIFIRTREPVAVGTLLHLDFKLQDAQQLLAGDGTVVWVREPDPNRSGTTPGMGVRFDKLTPESQQVLEQILEEKAKRDKSGVHGPNPNQSGGMAVRRPSSTFSALEPQISAKEEAPAAAPAPTPVDAEFTGPTTTASAINYKDLVASSARPPSATPAQAAPAPAAKTTKVPVAAAPVLGTPRPFIAGTPPTGSQKVELPSANEVDEAFAGMVTNGSGNEGGTPQGAAAAPPATRPAAPAESYRAPAFRTGRKNTGSLPIAESAATRTVDDPSSEPTIIASTPEALIAAAKRKAGVIDDAPTPGPEALAAALPELWGTGDRVDSRPTDPAAPLRSVNDDATAPGEESAKLLDLLSDHPSSGPMAPGSGLAPATGGPPSPPSLRESEPPPTVSGVFTAPHVAITYAVPPAKSAVIVDGGGSASLGGRSRKSKAPLLAGLLAATGFAALILWKLGVIGGGPPPTSSAPAPAESVPPVAAPAGTENPTAAANPAASEGNPAVVPAEKAAQVAAAGAGGSAALPESAKGGDDAKLEGAKAEKPGKTTGEQAEGAAPAPLPVVHQLRVVTTPGGAQIAVDGNPVGKSPYVDKTFDISNMHTITASKDGFEPWEKSVSAEDEWQRVIAPKGAPWKSWC